VPLRIGILCPSFPPGERPCGVGDFTRRLASALAEGGTEIAVLTGTGYRGAERIPGGKVRGIAREWGPRALGAVAAACREEGAHALLVQYAPDLYPPGPGWINSLPLAMRALSPGIPAVVSLHTVGVPAPGSMLGAALMILSAHALIATNEEVSHLLGKYLRPSLRKTVEIPIGANVEPPRRDPGARREARARFIAERGIPADAGLLAHFGLYYPGKGAEQILEAAGAWKREGRAFRLFMIGARREGDGGFYEGLRARGRGLGLAEEVIWTGYLPEEEASAILLGADLFLAPYEGGISTRRGSLMAALAHGLPVVSTPPRIPTRHFREGENFEPVPFGDAGALARAVPALLGDPARREKLARGADELAREFEWGQIAEKTRAFVAGVVKKACP